MGAIGPLPPVGSGVSRGGVGSDSPGFLRALRSPRTLVGAAGLTPALVLLLLSGVERFDHTAFGVLGPEIRDQFRLSDAGFVTLATLTSVLPLLATAHAGYLSDRTNRVRLAAGGALLWAATAVLTGLAPAVAVLIVARLIGGVGYTVNTPTHPSLLTDWYPARALPVVFGWYLIAYAAMGLIAGPLAGAITAASSWRVAFVVLALPTFVFALLLLRLREPARGESIGLTLRAEDATGVVRSFRILAGIRSIRWIWASAVFFGAGLVVLLSLLSLYFQDVWGFGPTLRGAISALFGAGGLAGLVVGGTLARRVLVEGRPERLPVVIGLMFLVGLAGGMLILAAVSSAPMAVGAVLICAIAYGGWAPAYYTQMSLITSPGLRGQAYAWSTMWFSLGGVIAAPVIGRVGDLYGQRVAFASLAVSVMVAGALSLRVSRLLRRDVETTKEALGALA